ncbi:hypothetical protein Ancab_004413 [Ancistrocladus abbreviatus]
MWVMDEFGSSVVHTAWKGYFGYADGPSLKRCLTKAVILKQWNKDHFGDIFKQMKRLQSELAVFQAHPHVLSNM